MLDIIEAAEVIIISLLSLYTVISNTAYIVRSHRCPFHNWEVGVPGVVVGLLILAFRFVDVDIPESLAVPHAFRRGITIIIMAIFASQARMREKCSD